MASKGRIVTDTPSLVLIEVEHAPADSFSRSVDPTATRQWHRSDNYSTRTRHRSASYAVDALAFMKGDRKVCVSVIAFASSFEAGEAAIARHTGVHADA
jgi:hypothetical protein